MKHWVWFVLSLMVLGFSDLASAQISIDANEYYSGLNNTQSASGNTYIDSSSSDYSAMAALINKVGANQIWDLSAFTYMPVTTNTSHDTIVPYSSIYPGASSFPNATNVVIATNGSVTTYAYLKEEASAVYAVGVAQDSSGVIAVVDNYVPPIQEVALPLTYQTSWSNSSQITTHGQSVTYDQYEVVDSYGTLIVPGAAPMQCLRLKDDAVYVIPGIGQDTVTILYTWITTTGYSAGVTYTPGFMQLSQPSYSTHYTKPISSTNSSVKATENDPFSMHVAQNPIERPTNVYFTMPNAGNVRVTLINFLGDVSSTLLSDMAHPGLNAARLDPTGIPNGTYFLRIQSGENASMQKIVIAR